MVTSTGSLTSPSAASAASCAASSEPTGGIGADLELEPDGAGSSATAASATPGSRSGDVGGVEPGAVDAGHDLERAVHQLDGRFGRRCAGLALEGDHLRGDLLGVHLELERRLLLGEERQGPRERPGEPGTKLSPASSALVGRGLLVDEEADVGGGGLVHDVVDDQLDRCVAEVAGDLLDPSGRARPR